MTFYYVAKEVYAVLRDSAVHYIRKYRSAKIIAVLAVAITMWNAVGLLLSFVFFERNETQYRTFRGTVAYEDGSLLPVTSLLVSLMPQGDAKTSQRYERPGIAEVDCGTGAFEMTMSYRGAWDENAGICKATLRSGDLQPLSTNIASSDYGDAMKTPLSVDTKDSPLQIRVRKPQGVAPAPQK